MLQLAHVARPGVGLQLGQGRAADLADRFPVLARVQLQEVVDQQGDVAGPLPELGQADLDGVDPVEQVLAKLLTADHLGDGHVGGADQAHVDRGRPVGAHADHLAVLQHGEQLGLQRQREVTDLVEEQTAARGDLKAAGPVAARIGEGPLDVAEEFAFEQVFAERAHVDADEHLCGAQGAAVDLAGDQLLARAVLAQDQDVGVGGRDLLDGAEHLLHGVRLADDAGERLVQVGAELLRARAQLAGFAPRLAEPQSRAHRGQ